MGTTPSRNHLYACIEKCRGYEERSKKLASSVKESNETLIQKFVQDIGTKNPQNYFPELFQRQHLKWKLRLRKYLFENEFVILSFAQGPEVPKKKKSCY